MMECGGNGWTHLSLHSGVLDVVGAGGDDPPDPFFHEGRGGMVASEVLEGHLDEPLVAIGPQSVATIAQGGAQNRTHRAPYFMHGQHDHRLLYHRSGCPAPLVAL